MLPLPETDEMSPKNGGKAGKTLSHPACAIGSGGPCGSAAHWRRGDLNLWPCLGWILVLLLACGHAPPQARNKTKGATFTWGGDDDDDDAVVHCRV